MLKMWNELEPLAAAGKGKLRLLYFIGKVSQQKGVPPKKLLLVAPPKITKLF